MTITEFLEARIAEDEADAIDRVVLRSEDRRSLTDDDAAKIHAECAAKRAIIKLCEVVGGMDAAIVGEWGGPGYGADEDILRALAAAYKDHADYQQDWTLGA